MRLALSSCVPVSLRLQPEFSGQATGFLWASWPLAVPERRGLPGKTVWFSSPILPVSLCLWARILSWGNAQGPPSGLPAGWFLGDSMVLWRGEWGRCYPEDSEAGPRKGQTLVIGEGPSVAASFPKNKMRCNQWQLSPLDSPLQNQN